MRSAGAASSADACRLVVQGGAGGERSGAGRGCRRTGCVAEGSGLREPPPSALEAGGGEVHPKDRRSARLLRSGAGRAAARGEGGRGRLSAGGQQRRAWRGCSRCGCCAGKIWRARTNQEEGDHGAVASADILRRESRAPSDRGRERLNCRTMRGKGRLHPTPVHGTGRRFRRRLTSTRAPLGIGNDLAISRSLDCVSAVRGAGSETESKNFSCVAGTGTEVCFSQRNLRFLG